MNTFQQKYLYLCCIQLNISLRGFANDYIQQCPILFWHQGCICYYAWAIYTLCIAPEEQKSTYSPCTNGAETTLSIVYQDQNNLRGNKPPLQQI